MADKTCFKCSRRLPLACFYKHKMMADGHLGKCKDCTRADAARNREENLERYREYDRSRSKDPLRAARQAKVIEGWIERNPEKRAAQVAVGNAVRDGRMFKPEGCEMCGTSDRRIHGHHDDYSKPLEVRWVCPPCHKEIHRGV